MRLLAPIGLGQPVVPIYRRAAYAGPVFKLDPRYPASQ
jgi:hypothetical protein